MPPSVLIIDDDRGMVETLADVFAAKGFVPTTAASGESALALTASVDYDLVLMDIKMPGLNGVQVLKAMHERDPHTAVIMMTAFTRDELVEEARRAQALAVLSKPLDLDTVLSLAEQAVGRRCTWRPPPTDTP